MDTARQLIRLPPTLTDGQIILDSHTLADAEAHLAGEDDEMLRRFDSPRRATLEETRAAMQRFVEARAAGGPMFAYAIRQPSGVLMGGCDLRLLASDRANVAYWIFPDFRGQGHASRALALMCGAAAAVPGLRQLEAHIAPDNNASRRVAERTGFIEMGTVQEEAWTGAVSTMVLYVRRL